MEAKMCRHRRYSIMGRIGVYRPLLADIGFIFDPRRFEWSALRLLAIHLRLSPPLLFVMASAEALRVLVTRE